jgi:ATP-dependent helicase/nuclease subunit A
MSAPGKNDVSFTTEQGTAIDPDINVWVSASAGTGKTQVLTARVLRLLLDEVPPEQILCVTFTKAAAAEMAQRIYATLAGWVSMADAELYAFLHGYLQTQDARDKMERARTLFARTLEARGGLKIQTLHSFCQSLLTRFPLEAGIAPGFATLDERTDMHLQSEALDSEIARAFNQSDRRFLDDLAWLSVRAADDHLLKAIRAFTAALAKIDPAGRLTADGIEPRVRTVLGLPLSGTANDVLQNAAMDGALDQDNLWHIVKIWMQGGKQVAGHATHLKIWLDMPVPANFSELMRAFFTAVGSVRADSKVTDTDTRRLDPELILKIGNAQQQIDAIVTKRRLFEIAEQSSAALRLSWSVLQTMQQTKNALGLVSFNDLIGKVADLLGAGGNDWVRHKLDDRISHVLVDEAQDTNADQWAILNALTDDFFSGAGARKNDRSIFVVGDFKQSVFSFQGADPKTYLAEQPKLAQRVEDGGAEFRALDLDTSFRSAPAVIDFVNEAITALGPENLGSADGFELHRAHRSTAGGEVCLWPLNPKNQSDIDPGDLRASLERDWDEKPERATATKIALKIKSWLSPQSPERLRGQRIRPQDIMVLVRKRGIIAQALVSDLKSMDVAVAGADRMKLGEQLAVQDLLAGARFCLQPEDDLTLAGFLKSPFFNWTEEQVFDLAWPRGPGQSLWTALRTHDTSLAGQTVRRLLDMLSASDTATPFRFFAEILERDGGRAALFSRLGMEVDDPVTALLDAALAFEQDHAPSLQAFVAWMDEDDSELKRDPDTPRNEVRVMTVHGAKGLEAPIVILADSHLVPASREQVTVIDNGSEKLPVWVARKEMRVGPVAAARMQQRADALQEYWRLFYVAITRARDRLYFAGWEPYSNPASLTWYQLAQSAFDRLDASTGEDGTRRFALAGNEPARAAVDGMDTPVTVLPDWALTPAPDEPVPPRPLTPSLLGGETLLIADPPLDRQAAAQARGTVLHKLLELLPQIPVSDRARAAVSILAHSGEPAETHAALLAEVDSVLSDAAFADVFGPQSLAEVPVTAVMGGTVLSGQIDRLAVTGAQVLVVDYKTTARPPAAPSEVADVYLRQMAAYRLALRQIYPDHQIVCALLWTATPVLMPLPDDLLDAAAASFVAN